MEGAEYFHTSRTCILRSNNPLFSSTTFHRLIFTTKHPSNIFTPPPPSSYYSALITMINIRIPAPEVDSLHSSALLTPPAETPKMPKDTPFKAKDDDQVSLSMTTRHKSHRRLSRACLSDQDVRLPSTEPVTTPGPRRSQSLPALRVRPKKKGMRRVSLARAGSGRSDKRSRRWTLPSKSAPTKCIAHTVPTISISVPKKSKKNLKKMTINENDSPAMITLRRATTVSTPRKMSLTFFPEPKFERSRTGFLSTFLSIVTGSEGNPALSFSEIYRQDTRRSSRTASVDSGKAQPHDSGSAPTVCTEVTGMEPRLSIPGQADAVTSRRRCSTKFISAGSVFEVIWDENGQSSSSAGGTPPSAPKTVIDNRRRSVAVEQLETQLFKAVAQSRRKSLAANQQLSRSSSIASQVPRPRGQTVRELLAFNFSQPTSDGLFDFRPKSRSPSKAVTPIKPSLRATIPDDEQVPLGVEFFPPLRSRATTGTSKVSSKHAVDDAAFQPTLSGRDTPKDSVVRRPSGMGNMIGASAHMRKKSAEPNDWLARHYSNAMNAVSRRSSAFIHPRPKGIVEDETVPLLGTVGMLE